MGAKFNTLPQKDFGMLIVSLRENQKRREVLKFWTRKVATNYGGLRQLPTDSSSKGGQLCDTLSYL